MLTIQSFSGIYKLEASQYLNISMEQAWQFFSSPANLVKITPPFMGFKITSGIPVPMYPGQMITYRVSPIPGFTTSWVTEITHVTGNEYFVDEQRFGPYRLLHHEHNFHKQAEGVMMTDRVFYKLPFGFLGRIAHALFVRGQLEKIFRFREDFLLKNELQ